ncbi:MAG: hypothetical protein ACE5HU_02945 [Acidobacteriota bacterium]
MPNSSGTWKTGERVVEAGIYVCLDCRQRKTTTHLTLKAGDLFPYCKTCDLKDNTYKMLRGER